MFVQGPGRFQVSLGGEGNNYLKNKKSLIHSGATGDTHRVCLGREGSGEDIQLMN